jgi:hypothetical protein
MKEEHYIKKEIHNFYPSPDIIRVIKSRRMRQTKHVSHTYNDKKNTQKFTWEEREQ